MTPMVTFVLVLLEAALITCASDWSYSGSNGPENWAKTYPDCGGKLQSPIDLTNFKHENGPQLKWSGYEEYPDSMTLTNNGLSVVLTSTGVNPTITTDGDKIYQLDNVHFHWGRKSSEGSEHTINNKRFTMEMHAVHMRVDEDGNRMTPNDILVAATFFEVSWATGKKGLSNFYREMVYVKKAGTNISVNPFPWSELIDQFPDDFFWYKGSLTTPPCTESVTYFIKTHPENIFIKQFSQFQALLDNDGRKMSGNFRPLQKRNGRSIFLKV